MVYPREDPPIAPSRDGTSSAVAGRRRGLADVGRDPRRVRRRRERHADPGAEDQIPRFGTLDNPVTLQTYDDNPPIDSNLEPEAGPLVIYNWEQYFWKQVLNDFSKKYDVEVKYETFYNMEQAIQKFQTGEVDYDVFFPTIDYVPKLVAAKLIQPLNHDYLSNTTNLWPVMQDPYYDQGSQYSLPYTITTPACVGGPTSCRWSRRSWWPPGTRTRSSGTRTTRARSGSTTSIGRRSLSGCTAITSTRPI